MTNSIATTILRAIRDQHSINRHPECIELGEERLRQLLKELAPMVTFERVDETKQTLYGLPLKEVAEDPDGAYLALPDSSRIPLQLP